MLRALTNSAEHGVVDQREYFNKDIATNTDNYYILETGDYVYNPRISSAAPVGPISKNQIGTGVMSPLYMVFRFRSEARRVGMDEIEAYDFNLNISRYVSTAEQEVAIDLTATNKELVEIEKQIRESAAKHNAFLKDLGLSPLPAPDK